MLLLDADAPLRFTRPCTKLMRDAIRKSPNGKIVMFLLPPIKNDRSFAEDANISEMQVTWICYTNTEEELRLVDVGTSPKLDCPPGADFIW
jgi:hypothetical protein